MMKVPRSPAAIAALSVAGLMLSTLSTLSTPSAEAAPGGCPGFPNAGCTGVPAGTNLTEVTGDLVVTTDGEVVSGKNVNGCIVVRAPGVTVQNSRAQCVAVEDRARDAANPRLTVQDVEIDCRNQGGSNGIGDRNMNVYRANIHNCENGFDADSDMTITDSYIHDLFTLPDDTPNQPHMDGLQSALGSNMVIDHNTIYGFDTGCRYPNNGSCNGTSALFMGISPSGPSTNTTISNNLLAGGAYTLYCPDSSAASFRIVGNRFSTVYSPNVGEYAPSTNCGGVTQSGNVYHESGAPLTLE
jgi:hypothetical protein